LNKKDRQELTKIQEELSLIWERLNVIADEEEDKACALEEYFPEAERTDTIREKADLLLEIAEDLEAVKDRIDEVIY